MGNRGTNSTSFALWEELKLRVSPEAGCISIYKWNGQQQHLPIEERSYHIHIPVPNTKGGIRKSLRVADRATAISKAEDELLEVKVQLRQGGSVVPVSVELVVEKFLKYKKSLVRGEWESKDDAGKRSITKERYTLIQGKLYNYLVPFLGRKTDA